MHKKQRSGNKNRNPKAVQEQLQAPLNTGNDWHVTKQLKIKGVRGSLLELMQKPKGMSVQ